MVNNEKNQNPIRRYLLGVLDESNQQELEQRLLTDEKVSEEIQIAEEELVDDYLAERLTPDERVHFETHFLAAPERHDDLKFSRTFKQFIADSSLTPTSENKVSSQTPALRDGFSFGSLKQRPAIGYSIVTACVLALLIAGWLMWLSKESRTGREQIEQELARLNEQNRGGQSTTQPSSGIYRVRLTAGLARGAGATKTLQISPQSNSIEIELEVPIADYVTYQATLISEGAELYSVSNLAPSPATGMNIVRLRLLPKHLASGDYQIKLSGKASDGKTESVGSYSFRVVLV